METCQNCKEEYQKGYKQGYYNMLKAFENKLEDAIQHIEKKQHLSLAQRIMIKTTLGGVLFSLKQTIKSGSIKQD